MYRVKSSGIRYNDSSASFFPDLRSELILASMHLVLCRVAVQKVSPYIDIVQIIFFGPVASLG